MHPRDWTKGSITSIEKKWSLNIQESIGAQARQWKNGVKKGTIKEKYKGTHQFLDRIRKITEDVSIDHLQYF